MKSFGIAINGDGLKQTLQCLWSLPGWYSNNRCINSFFFSLVFRFTLEPVTGTLGRQHDAAIKHALKNFTDIIRQAKKLGPKRIAVAGAPDDSLAEALDRAVVEGIAIDGLDEIGCISYDQGLHDIARQSKTIFDLDKDNPAFVAVKEILKKNLS